MASRNGLFTVYVRDSNGAETSSAVNIISDDASTLANILSRGTSGVVDFDSVMDAMVYDATISFHVPVTGAKASPVAGSDITQTGTLNFGDGTPYAAPVVIPGLSNSVLVAGGIDLTNADVVTLKNFLMSASSTLMFVSRALGSLLALKDALFSFRKRRKAISKKTKA